MVPQSAASLRNFSQPFVVLPGPLARLGLQQNVQDVMAGVLLDTDPLLLLTDAYNNSVRDGHIVSVSLLNHMAGLNGPALTVGSVNGSVVFRNLSVTVATDPEGRHTLVFECWNIFAFSNRFRVLPSPVDENGSLQMVTQPFAAIAGESFGVQPVVRISDRFGNLAVSYSGYLVAVFDDVRGTGNISFSQGFAVFTDLGSIIPKESLKISFSSPELGIQVFSQPFRVAPPVQSLRIMRQPTTVLAGICMMPYPILELIDAAGNSTGLSRQSISVGFSVNTFRQTKTVKCGSAGCWATTTFRYFLPGFGVTLAKLVSAFVNVYVSQSDYDDHDELVEYISVNGVPLVTNCRPGGADQCSSYFKCADRLDVTQFARSGVVEVTVKISGSVDDFCLPRLNAYIELFGSYRPAAVEYDTADERGVRYKIGGTLSLMATGRTMVWRGISFPVPGSGYRIRFSDSSGAVSVESQPFDVLAVAAQLQLLTQPEAAVAEEPFGIQPLVALRDALGNAVTSEISFVTVAIASAQKFDSNSANPFACSDSGCWTDLAMLPLLGGAEILTASLGRVKYQDLFIDQAVDRVVLRFSSSAKCSAGKSNCSSVALTVLSAPFQVFPPVRILAADLQTGTGAIAGRPLPGPPQVELRDEFNKKAGFSASVVLVTALDASGAHCRMLGTSRVVAAQGTALFADLRLLSSSVNCRLQFWLERNVSISVLTPFIRVSPASPSSVRLSWMPMHPTISDDVFISARLLDEFGNEAITNLAAVGLQTSQDPTFIVDKSVQPVSNGMALFQFQFRQAKTFNLSFSVALSADTNCSQADGSVCSHPDGLSYCEIHYDGSQGANGCVKNFLCAYAGSGGAGSCHSVCACPSNLRRDVDRCSSCFVSTSLNLEVGASANFGNLTMTVNPASLAGIEGHPFLVQPSVLLQTCIGVICSPLIFFNVTVNLTTNYPGCFDPDPTLCPEFALQGLNTITTSSTGIASFTDLAIAQIKGTIQTVLGLKSVLDFSALGGRVTARTSSIAIQVQEPSVPEFLKPTPLLCSDPDEVYVFYVFPGSRFIFWVMASAFSTDQVVDIRFEQEGHNAGYFTSPSYEAANSIRQRYVAECGQVTYRSLQLRNRAARAFVWSPVSFVPSFKIHYETLATDSLNRTKSSCRRSVSLVVCSRPQFLLSRAPDGVGNGEMEPVLGLARTWIALNVTAYDVNEGDTVAIDVLAGAGPGFEISETAFQPEHLITGLDVSPRNRVYRQLVWSVPDASPVSVIPAPATICLQARDDSFSCNQQGLESEEVVCISCVLDQTGVFATCTPRLQFVTLAPRDVVAICGDGRITGSENCDDSNHVDGDGCSSLCRLEYGYMLSPLFPALSGPVPTPICGDGLAVSGETCDDGNNRSFDGCSANCTIEFGYMCQECGGRSACNSVCGDDIVIDATEQCDDGNVLSGDGCSSRCEIESGWLCTAGNTICSPRCGNGVRSGLEQCDDNNTISGDGCSSACIVEPGWNCSRGSNGLSLCLTVCGDGYRQGKEQCDDGNQFSSDGCNANCVVEVGWLCLSPSNSSHKDVCQASRCGDGMRTGAEQCDDNNIIDGDGCSAVCTLELGWQCRRDYPLPDTCSANCGDGLRQGPETCDDGNAISGDGCGSSCRVEPGFVCNHSAWNSSDSCAPLCGDGRRVGSESCDDGNRLNGDGCSASCVLEFGWYCVGGSPLSADNCSTICGDAIRSGTERCDDGAWTLAYGDGCNSSCFPEPGFLCEYDNITHHLVGGSCRPICGDGLWVLREQCDDDNNVNGDGCSSECTVEDGWACGGMGGGSPPDTITVSLCMGICGDGERVASEQCDDGNMLSGDGCSSSCVVEAGYECRSVAGELEVCYTFCGDGFVAGKESCDDNNTYDGDGCSSICKIELGWECIPANCSMRPAQNARCSPFGEGHYVQELVFGVGSYCEACPPVRDREIECSNPPCPPPGLTEMCPEWRLFDDGGWYRVVAKDNQYSALSNPDLSPQECMTEWKSDGFCDAVNNRAECGWDDGDCCLSTCLCGPSVSTLAHGAGSRCYTTYNSAGGCGAFRGRDGDFRCLDPSAAAAATPTITVLGTHNNGAWVSQAAVTLGAADGSDIFYTLDGSDPIVFTATDFMVVGFNYSKVGPFNVTVSCVVRAVTLRYGLGRGVGNVSVSLRVADVVISPVSTTPRSYYSVPLLITLATETVGASIYYVWSPSDVRTLYTGPFAVGESGSISAVAQKQGLADSPTSRAAYSLEVSRVVFKLMGTPTLLANGTVADSGLFDETVTVALEVEPIDATVIYTLCRSDIFPGLVRMSSGRMRQTASDVCYPACEGVCVGGFFDGAACAGASDLETCRGGGNCSVYMISTRTCLPNESTALSQHYNGSFTLNTTALGGPSIVVTAWAQKAGLASTSLWSKTIRVTAGTLRLLVLGTKSQEDPAAYSGPVQLNFSTDLVLAKVQYTLDGVTDPATAGTPDCPLVPVATILGALSDASLAATNVYNFSASFTGCKFRYDPAIDIPPVLTRSANLWAIAINLEAGLGAGPPIRQQLRLRLAAVNLTAVGYTPDPTLCTSSPAVCMQQDVYVQRYAGSACCYNSLCSASGACPPRVQGGGVVFPLQRESPADFWCSDTEGTSCSLSPAQAGAVFISVFVGLSDGGYDSCVSRYATATQRSDWANLAPSSLAAYQTLLASLCPRASVYFNVTDGAGGWPITTYSTSTATFSRGAPYGYNLSVAGRWLQLTGNATIRAFAAVGVQVGVLSTQPIYVRTPCPPGYTSRDGLWPCTPCPQDTFFDSGICPGLFGCSCLPCPEGQGTLAPASVGDSACSQWCEPGTYRVPGGLQGQFSNCINCPKGTYQPLIRGSSCLACPRGLTTESTRSKALYQCHGVAGVTAGGFHSCGVRSDYSAVCWGLNSFGCVSSVQ
jgi:cysteine-rich repeat protein